jgi:FkbM family methyltransferase
MKSYSEFGQDKWVLKTLDFKRDGYFVDIGAGDPIRGSNTYFMESELGWKGICVEPLIEKYEQLLQKRSCSCVNTCLFSSAGSMDFVVNLAYSGIVFDEADVHVKKLAQKNKEKTVKLRTMTLNELLDNKGAPLLIDYISMDTEGSEFEILKNFDFEKYRVQAWTIEHNHNQVMRDKILKLLTSKGYIFAFNKHVDDFYMHESLKDKLKARKVW